MKNQLFTKKILVKIKSLLSNSKRGKLSYSQCGEDLIVSFIFAVLGINKISYLDVGAYNPYVMSNTALFYKNGSRGINIEPNPILFNKFKSQRKKDINLNIGISDKNGLLGYYFLSSPALNTFSKEEALKLIAGTGQKIIKTEKIEVKTITEVVSEYNKGMFPDFLSIDTEGLEELILSSINYEKGGPKVICVETISYSENNTGIKNTDLKSFLETKGYILFADTYINSIFVKKDLWTKK